jgi:hypothetical protein
MENVKKFLPLIAGGIVAVVVFILSKRMRKNSESSIDRSTILEKAREAKLAKSILRKTEDEESIANLG